MNDAGKPFIYLQNSIAGNPPILMVGNQKYPLPENTALLWLEIIVEFIRQRGVREHGRGH